jgi:hypothetical protein
MRNRVLSLLFIALLSISCDTSTSDMTQSTPPSIDIDTQFDVNVRYRQRDTAITFTVKAKDFQYLGREKVIRYSTTGYPDFYLATDPNGDVASAEEGGDWFVLPVGSKTQITHDPHRSELIAGSYKITETTVTPKGQETFTLKGKAYIGEVFEATNIGTYYNSADVKQNADTTTDKHVYSKEIGFWLEQKFNVGSIDEQTNSLLDFRF